MINKKAKPCYNAIPPIAQLEKSSLEAAFITRYIVTPNSEDYVFSMLKLAVGVISGRISDNI